MVRLLSGDSMKQPRLKLEFQDYSQHHRNRTNLILHEIGIPMIMISLLGLLGHLRLSPHPINSSHWGICLNSGVILWALATLWYLALDWKIAIPFGLFSLGIVLIGLEIPGPFLWGLFTAGWLLQLTGHAIYEKNRPAFLQNLKHLLIGPLWIFSRWIGYWGLVK